ncbi:MAG: CvpA family protein [Alphaproteobacteria bacterium]|nr:CvpA family protein [Alphaproteobacteria bacterium]
MEDLPANAADLIVIAVLLVSALLAFSRGFVRELLSVAVWVGAIFATLYGLAYVKEYTSQWISTVWLANTAASVTIFIPTLIILALISHVLSGQVRNSALGAVDRSLGFLFGLLRGVIIVCLAYLMITLILPKEEQPKWLRSARTILLVEQGAGLLLQLVPEGAMEKSGATMGRATEKTSEAIREQVDEAIQMENRRMLESLTSPRLQGDTKGSGEGYSNTQRQDMDRLFETKDNP